MQLFDAIENCFPAMEKQYQEICPPPEEFAPGCRFCDRCERRKDLSPEEQERCRCEIPAPVSISNTHTVYCRHPFAAGTGNLE